LTIVKTKKNKKGKGKGKGKKKVKKTNKKKKLNKHKKKGKKGKKDSVRQSSCTSAQIDAQVFVDMVDSLEYERNQIFNFNQQKLRVEGQKRLCEGKRGKNELFLVPATYLANAIGVNGTDTNNVKCGDGLANSEAKEVSVALSVYNFLMQCPESVFAACDWLDVYNDTTEERYASCNTEFAAISAQNAVCKDKPEAEIGTCWSDQQTEIKRVKALGCTKFSADLSKAMGLRQARCLESDGGFVSCKKAEDEAVFHSGECNHGTVKTLDEISKEATDLTGKLVDAKLAVRTRLGNEYSRLKAAQEARTDGNLLDNFDEDEDDLAVDEMEDDGFSFEL